MSAVSILVGDCLASLRAMADQSVNTCVTSPPYFGLRDYGHAGQIGLEQTPDEFVAKLVEVFRGVRRVLRDDGTLWLNLGDSYGSAGGNTHAGFNARYHGTQSVEDKQGQALDGVTERTVYTGLGAKNLLGIPWRVAFALQADGWTLRQDIIWHKPNPMPESVKDRCTKAHEYIFLLSKGPRYYFDSEAMQEDAIYGARGSQFDTGKTGAHQMGRASSAPRQSKVRGEFNGKTNALAGREAFRAIRDTRNRRSVWTVATKPFKGAHFATFPPDLIEPCVLAGCPEGGTVLDPFGGAGTTGLVAARNSRNSILCELNPEYAAMAAERIGLTATITPPQPNHEKVDA